MKSLILVTIFVSGLTANLNAGVISKAFKAWDQEQIEKPGLFPTPKERLEAGWAKKNIKFQIIKSELKSHIAQVVKSKAKSSVESNQELGEVRMILEKLDRYLDQKLEDSQSWLREVIEQVQAGNLKSHSDYQAFRKEKRTLGSVTLSAKEDEVIKALSQVKKKRKLQYSPEDEAIQEAYRELCRKSFTVQYKESLFDLKAKAEKRRKNLTYSMAGRQYGVTAEDWEKYETLKEKAIKDPIYHVIISGTSRWRLMLNLEKKEIKQQVKLKKSCDEFLLSISSQSITSSAIEDEYEEVKFPSLLQLLKSLKKSQLKKH